MNPIKKICITPKVSGVGGMVSFRYKLTAGLQERGFVVTNDLNDTPYEAVLVIGGTRNLPGLWKVKRSGVRIVQRLNGMNWLHRIRPTGLKHKIRAEIGNWILAAIRRYLADAVIYQSEFARGWWNRVYGPLNKEITSIHNAVDLTAYSPDGPETRSDSPYQVLLVEGSLGGGYEIGLETAARMVSILRKEMQMNVELMVVGKASDGLRKQTEADFDIPITWKGLVPRDTIPQIDRTAHLLYSADINAACPNSVIEALACGLPVLAFDTGALPELVGAQAGAVIPYGGDPWKVEPPDVPGLASAAAYVLRHNEEYRQNARAHAEQAFNLDKMVDAYLAVLLNDGAAL